jgi:AcrR family transcriptional regulator
MPKSETMRLASRERILKAAMELFVAKGFHDTTTREITVAAGISKGLMYNYFASKEAILEGIIDLRTQDISAIIAQCRVAGDAGASIARLITAYCHMLRRDRDYLRFRTALVLQPGIPAAVTARINLRVQQLFDAICALLADVGIHDARQATYELMARLEGMGLHYLGVLQDYPLDHMQQQLIQEYVRKYS